MSQVVILFKYEKANKKDLNKLKSINKQLKKYYHLQKFSTLIIPFIFI